MLNGVLNFRRPQHLFRTGRFILQPFRRFNQLALIGLRLDRDGGPAALAAQFVVTGVGHNAQKPTLKGSPAISVQLAIHGDDGFLGGIRGGILVCHDAVRHVISYFLVLEHELIKGVKVSINSTCYQFGLFHDCLHCKTQANKPKLQLDFSAKLVKKKEVCKEFHSFLPNNYSQKATNYKKECPGHSFCNQQTSDYSAATGVELSSSRSGGKRMISRRVC